MKKLLSLLMTVFVALSAAGAAGGGAFQSDKERWEHLPADSLNRMAMTYINVANMPDSALLCLSIIANRFSVVEPQGADCKLYASALHDISFLYQYYYGDYYKARTYLQRAKEETEKAGCSSFMPYIYMSFANLYLADSSVKQHKQYFEKTIQMYKKAFASAVDTRQWNPMQPIFINMVQVAFGVCLIDSVADEIAQFQLLDIPEDTYEHGFASSLCRAMVLWQRSQPDSAIVVMRDAPIDSQLPAKQREQLATIRHDMLYHAYCFTGRNQEALTELAEMEQMAGDAGDAAGLADVYHYYYEFYSQQPGQSSLADHYELLWLRQKDEVISQNRVNEMNDAEFIMEIARMNGQVKTLQQQRQLQRRTIIIVSVFLLITILLLVLLVVSYVRLRERGRYLYEKSLALIAADDSEQRKEAGEEAPAVKYRNNQMDTDSAEELLRRVMHIMRTSDAIFQESFSMAQLADLVGAKQNYISQAINSTTSQTFNTLLAEFRIKEACRRMKDTANYGNFTIEGIGQSVGFKSRPYFVQLFKRHTGLTPSAYMKMAREDSSEQV